jgi:hypothetical protein
MNSGGGPAFSAARAKSPGRCGGSRACACGPERDTRRGRTVAGDVLVDRLRYLQGQETGSTRRCRACSAAGGTGRNPTNPRESTRHQPGGVSRPTGECAGGQISAGGPDRVSIGWAPCGCPAVPGDPGAATSWFAAINQDVSRRGTAQGMSRTACPGSSGITSPARSCSR